MDGGIERQTNTGQRMNELMDALHNNAYKNGQITFLHHEKSVSFHSLTKQIVFFSFND